MYHPGIGQTGIFTNGVGVFDDDPDAEQPFAQSVPRRVKKAQSPFVAFKALKPAEDAPFIFINKKKERALMKAGGVPVPVIRPDRVMVPSLAPTAEVFEPQTTFAAGKFVFPSGLTRQKRRADASFVREPVELLTPKAQRFLAVNTRPLRTQVREDIRREVEPFPSAAGLSGNFLEEIAQKIGIKDEQIQKALEIGKTAKETFDRIRGEDIKEVAVDQQALERSLFQAAQQTPAQPAPKKKGLSTGTILLLVGGGIAVVAIGALLIKSKRR